MKSDVFNQYVERVTDLFDITKEQLFSKSRMRTLVDARYLLFYLCHKRPMQIMYIQKYMGENGYPTPHSSICHGIASIEKRVADDKDYLTIVKEIEKSVFI